MNLKKNTSQNADRSNKDGAHVAPNIGLHKQLTELDDLRQKGILSQEEFDAEKKKFLKK